jgi:hypothetical protein
MRFAVASVVLLSLLGCGGVADETSDGRQFGLGDAIEDPALIARLLAHPAPHVRRAAELKVQVDRHVRADLARLANELRSRPPTPPAELLAAARALLGRERDALTDLKASLDTQTGEARGQADLRTSLGKLLGNGTYSGILDDAAALLDSTGERLAAGALPEPYPRHNALTVTKAAQLALVMAATGQRLAAMPELVDGLELLYPARIPASVPDELASAPAFTGSRALLVPNAGYVFGGAAIDGRVRGFDCSAYLSMATESSVRLSTGVMEFAWREMRGDSFAEDDPDGRLRAEMRGWGLAEAELEYEAVTGADGGPVALADLRPGDLVVWRYPRSYPTRSGHVAMFAAAGVPNGAAGEFLGLEATRADDKSREGVLVRGFDLEPNDAFTLVLRRRPH